MTPDEYWEAVEKLGVTIIDRMADCADYVGRTEDGRIVQVTDPERLGDDASREGAFLLLMGHVARLFH